jgi:hypothetical protein
LPKIQMAFKTGTIQGPVRNRPVKLWSLLGFKLLLTFCNSSPLHHRLSLLNSQQSLIKLQKIDWPIFIKQSESSLKSTLPFSTQIMWLQASYATE